MCKQCDLSKENNEENELCPYAHNILKDFRIIFNYKEESIRDFMSLLFKSNLFNFENYLKYIPMDISSKFNLNTFKVHKCPKDKECQINYHKCPYYHTNISEDEPRRPPSLFKYSNTPCNKYYDRLIEKYYRNYCIFGIFCQFLHNQNEDNYHPNNYIKNLKTKKLMNTISKYYKACYEIENEKSENDKKDINNNKKEFEKERKKDENLEKIKKNVEKSLEIGKIMICRLCNNIPINGDLCFFIKCKHYLCFKCFKYLNKEKKKEKNDKLLCPFCGEELKKNKLVSVNFKKKKE